MSEDDGQDPADTQESQLGAVLHAEHWGWDHKACIVLCRRPARVKRRGRRCPDCYGPVRVADLETFDLDPPPALLAWRAGYFLGGWAAAWKDAAGHLKVRKPAAMEAGE